MNATGWSRGLEVTGVVSHAGLARLRQLSDRTGLTSGLSAALPSPLGGHDRGRVFADLACVIADGARVISDFRVMSDQRKLFGAVAVVPTAWRALSEMASRGDPGDGARSPPRYDVATGFMEVASGTRAAHAPSETDEREVAQTKESDADGGPWQRMAHPGQSRTAVVWLVCATRSSRRFPWHLSPSPPAISSRAAAKATSCRSAAASSTSRQPRRTGWRCR